MTKAESQWSSTAYLAGLFKVRLKREINESFPWEPSFVCFCLFELFYREIVQTDFPVFKFKYVKKGTNYWV